MAQNEERADKARPGRPRKYGAIKVKGVAGVRCPKCKVFTPAGVWALAHTDETEITFKCPVNLDGHVCGKQTIVPRYSW